MQENKQYKSGFAALIGRPNVGKSTLLSRVTNARPKIANYHFTTLNPNLGVVDLDDGKGFVIADIPGLIEGASEGVGLGYEFLRHIERTKVLIHLVDAASTEGRDPIADIYAIRSRLEGLCARWATDHITQEQLEKMEEVLLLSEFYGRKKEDGGHIVELDSEFHKVLYEASNSRIPVSYTHLTLPTT